jgi:peptidoglycan/xylan/chitin deacetylase (PgdA/CDA1 family)
MLDNAMNMLFKIAKKVTSFLSFPPKSLGTVFMLHRCSPLNGGGGWENLYWNEHMKVSPEFLSNFLIERSRTHTFISLDTLFELSKTRKRLKKPFLVMTFDDGYRDNYEYALPLFDKMRIPFAVYVTNSFPDKKAFLWWYALEDVLQKNDSIVLSDGTECMCDTKDKKEMAFLRLRTAILALNQGSIEEEFNKLFGNYTADYTASQYNEELCLSWDMIQEMANSNYCTIAAHTMNHKTLNRLTDTDLEYEILGGRKALEEKTGKRVRHFAYPFGTYNEIGGRETAFLKKCGFDTACYSFGGDVTRKNINNSCELPRVFLGELRR